MQKRSMSNMQKISTEIGNALNEVISNNSGHVWHIVFDRSYPDKKIFDACLKLQRELYDIINKSGAVAYVYNVADKIMKNSGEILQPDIDYRKLPRVRISPASMRPANLNYAWQSIYSAKLDMPERSHSLILIARADTEVSPSSKISFNDIVFSNAVIIPADAKAVSEWETKSAFIGLSGGPYKISALDVKLTLPLCPGKEALNKIKRKYTKKVKIADSDLPVVSADAYACINYVKHLDAYTDAGIKIITGELSQVLTEFKQACHDERPSRAVLLQISTHAIIAEYELREAFSVKPEILKEVNAQKLY